MQFEPTKVMVEGIVTDTKEVGTTMLVSLGAIKNIFKPSTDNPLTKVS